MTLVVNVSKGGVVESLGKGLNVYDRILVRVTCTARSKVAGVVQVG